MDNATLARAIEQKALELGYEACGIIPVAEMAGFADRVAERLEKAPTYAQNSDFFYRMATPQGKYPWAKAVVVCIQPYNQYDIPSHLLGLIGRAYLTDCRADTASPGHQASVALVDFMEENGLQTAYNRKFPLTAVRWAAQQAGVGGFRRNNFIYTEKSGSWLVMEVFLIDRALELKHELQQKPCPEGCDLCVKACPTQSLSAPYLMDRVGCVSHITTWGDCDYPNADYSEKLGGWMFGCDVCQDVCPQNRGKWKGGKAFPGLDALGEAVSLEQVVLMDYDTLRTLLQPKLWYIEPDEVWKYKATALNAMKNTWQPCYAAAVEAACNDEVEQVRRVAGWVKAATAR
ncbi:MAG: epoxyqueuosine reductase [Ruminococcaceae bacterium]|nr:epoxyqueuosine reductase [Oscillospiraceae bacterium]